MDMMSEKVSSSLFAEVVLPVLGADGLPKRSASLIAGAAGFWVFSPFHAVEAVAITVTIISSSIVSSNAAPQ